MDFRRSRFLRWSLFALLAGFFVLSSGATGFAQPSATDDPVLIQAADLVHALKSTSSRPLILQVGFHVLYQQAHIPGAEYIGPTSKADGISALQKRVEGLSRTQSIVLYCGCCPWVRCPNVHPAYQALRALGFTKVQVLFIKDNFGKDWVDQGYPVARGDAAGTL